MSTSTGDFVNPPAFRLHRCYYCRTSKPDAIRYDGDIIYRLMYGRITPLRDNKGKTDLHQIWLCNDCVEWDIGLAQN